MENIYNEVQMPVKSEMEYKMKNDIKTVSQVETDTNTTIAPKKLRTKHADICAICLERLTFNRRNIHETVCGHKFHSLCFRNITQKRCKEVKCPCCRKEVEHEPVRKIFELNKELESKRQEEYREAHINFIDLNTSNDRIDYLKLLLQREREENIKIKETSKNSTLYYKIFKNELKQRIQTLRESYKRTLVIKRLKKAIQRNTAATAEIEAATDKVTHADI
jgi:hypothetical protein